MKYKFKDRIYDDTTIVFLVNNVCRYNSCANKCPLDLGPNKGCFASTYSAAIVNKEDADYINTLQNAIINRLLQEKIIVAID